MSSPINGNRILSVLALEGTHPIFSRLISVPLTARQVLAAPSASLNYGYFITKGMACGLTVMKNGATVTDHLIGPEGFVGFSLLFGVLNDQTLIKIQPVTVVQVPGNSLRIDAAAFIEEYNRPGSFQDIMRRYALARMAAITQTAACNTIHCIEGHGQFAGRIADAKQDVSDGVTVFLPGIPGLKQRGHCMEPGHEDHAFALEHHHHLLRQQFATGGGYCDHSAVSRCFHQAAMVVEAATR